MRRAIGFLFVLIACLLPVSAMSAGGGLKAGWTTEAVDGASAECTEALIQGTWENTKREQGIDPSKPFPDEMRKQLASEIAKMKKLCACAVREGAKRYTRAEAEAGPADLERAVSESIEKGVCKLEP
jgi:hypothetical protein